jgi:hypothetical protein
VGKVGANVSDAALARIPFRAQDELMIESMARWMRFIGMVMIISGLLMVFLIVVFTTALVFAPPLLELQMGKVGEFVRSNRALLTGLAAATAVLTLVSIYAGNLLCQAADDFDKVVTTDVADQSFVAAGLDKVRLYFQVIVLAAVASVVVALVAGLAIIALAAAHA